MTIQTTIRRSWLMAAVITLLATGQASAQGVKNGINANFVKSKVGIRHKKQLHRAVRPITIRQSASKNAASGLTRQVARARALRPGRYKDSAGNTSTAFPRKEDGVLWETDRLGQDSARTTISQVDIERLRTIEAILDIRELYELDSLIGRDLASTQGQVMDMIDAALQDLNNIIAASTRSMSGVGLAEDRAAYTRGTVFGAASDWLEDLGSEEGKGRFDDPDGDGFPNALDDDDDGDGVDDKDDKYPYDPKRSIFPENEVWLLSEGIPRELFGEFVYQWLLSDMTSESLLEGDLDMLMRLATEGWMTESGWMTEY
ncbi:MAG: hypothetical protein VB861_17665 [Planctomycetaceae bacterium]